jgi:catechol 2,3-dioxygenase-like lactoylglutathione lyase family enzyme
MDTQKLAPRFGYARWVAPPPFVSIDHVQLAIPRGGEAAARSFYGELLGLAEVPKPPVPAARGGCWFEAGEVKIHLGVEDDFRPARKAHPALRCRDYAGLVARLRGAGVAVREAADVPGVTRCHIDDPFGNRIELIADA